MLSKSIDIRRNVKPLHIAQIRLGVIGIALFFVLEFVTDYWLGALVPGYDWKSQSISYIGNSSSPVLVFVKVWGVAFSLLMMFFARAYFLCFGKRKGAILATFMLIMYGLGEGIGSAFFPIDPLGSIATLSSFLHNLLSGIGDAGLVLLPFVFMVVFPKTSFPSFQKYLWSVVLVGFMLASLFLIAKYFTPDNFILEYKGLWQRLYLLNYYILLLFIGISMWPKKSRATLSEETSSY